MADLLDTLLDLTQLDELRRQHGEYQAQIDDLRARQEAVARLIEVIERSNPSEVAAVVGEDRPGLREAVLLVMHDGVPDDTLWTADEMVAALVRRGWGPGGKTPRNSVAATLSRLTQMGELERVNSGLYRLAAHKRQPSTPAATGEEGQLDMGHEGGNP